ncbi:hypothetical protein PUN28_012277 [Cardiocondyla obscurior]|uniref:Uncharacterized protein n=1 Tax=Cardiocondyla obscurior TaxID=286306 RepID=A0AAW2FAE0_9HYME
MHEAFTATPNLSEKSHISVNVNSRNDSELIRKKNKNKCICKRITSDYLRIK